MNGALPCISLQTAYILYGFVTHTAKAKAKARCIIKPFAQGDIDFNVIPHVQRSYVYLEVAIDGIHIGRVTAELYDDIVPRTAKNFRKLVTGEMGQQLSYANSTCHRIIKDFIVQCGDFETGKGYGGRSIYGRHFDDEKPGLLLKHSRRYILQMANSGPNSNGSQFCFMLRATPHLNTHHVVFGQVVDGFEVVDKMEEAGTTRDGEPLQHVVVLKRGGLA